MFKLPTVTSFFPLPRTNGLPQRCKRFTKQYIIIYYSWRIHKVLDDRHGVIRAIVCLMTSLKKGYEKPYKL